MVKFREGQTVKIMDDCASNSLGDICTLIRDDNGDLMAVPKHILRDEDIDDIKEEQEYCHCYDNWTLQTRDISGEFFKSLI